MKRGILVMRPIGRDVLQHPTVVRLSDAEAAFVRVSAHPLAVRLRFWIFVLGHWPAEYPPTGLLVPLLDALRAGQAGALAGLPRRCILRLHAQGVTAHAIGRRIGAPTDLVEQTLIWEGAA